MTAKLEALKATRGERAEATAEGHLDGRQGHLGGGEGHPDRQRRHRGPVNDHQLRHRHVGREDRARPPRGSPAATPPSIVAADLQGHRRQGRDAPWRQMLAELRTENTNLKTIITSLAGDQGRRRQDQGEHRPGRAGRRDRPGRRQGHQLGGVHGDLHVRVDLHPEGVARWPDPCTTLALAASWNCRGARRGGVHEPDVRRGRCSPWTRKHGTSGIHNPTTDFVATLVVDGETAVRDPARRTGRRRSRVRQGAGFPDPGGGAGAAAATIDAQRRSVHDDLDPADDRRRRSTRGSWPCRWCSTVSARCRRRRSGAASPGEQRAGRARSTSSSRRCPTAGPTPSSSSRSCPRSPR